MKRGFTLIELLIVIGILAILSTATVLVINPVEILKQARDTQRITDLKSLSSAISLYLARHPSPSLNPINTDCTGENTFLGHSWLTTAISLPGNPQNLPAGRQPFVLPEPAVASQVIDPVVMRSINGTGWVPVALTNLANYGTNPPLAKLPVDPINDGSGPLVTTGLHYAYQCQGLTFEINANMESVKYSNGGDKDVESTDGGTLACSTTVLPPNRCTAVKAAFVYEIGNAPGLAL
jgi:prepilin-type N-terminal cleavage/methylation domain-containing protein